MKVIFQGARQRFQSERIRYKYFLLILCLSVFPVFLLGFMSYNIAKDALVQNQLQATRSHLQTSSEAADLLFRNIINMERLISWNVDIQQELKDSVTYTAGEHVISRSTAKRMQNLIASYLIDTQDIDSVCLFDVHDRSVCYGSSSSVGNSIGQYGNGNVNQEVKRTDWYKESVERDGRAVFFGHNVLTDDSSTFSSVKLLKDPGGVFNPQKTGMLVVNIKKSMFARVFKEDKNDIFAVLASSRKGVQEVFQYPPSFQMRASLKSSLPSAFQELQSRGYLLSSHTNETTGWTFVEVIKEKELLKQSNQIGVLTAFIALFIACVALFLSFLLSNTVSRPLLQLKQLTIDWAKGLWGNSEAAAADDIEMIGQTFQRITVEHKELSEQLVRAQLREREAELRTLQAQIKPHFLYNTLDSIYWMAVLQKNDDIAKIAIALSESFKLSLNNGEDVIPVSKEVEHIRHYMTIQNIRYRNRFQYVEEIEPAVMEKTVLKLLLQPLVENAIYHGLEPKVGEGRIILMGRTEGDWIILTVSDNGVGIADLEATKRGYGLRNVQERLALCYGPESTLTIFSKVGEGTSIELRFRDKMKEE